MKRRPGFSLVELLVVVGIMGTLAAIVSVNAVQSQAKARDANRIATVKQYQGAMQLNRSSVGSYFVYRPISYSLGEISSLAPYQFDTAGRPMVADPVRAALPTTLVGYRGAGWGRMLAAGTASGNYSQQYSIVEALIYQGFLSQLKFDSRMRGAQDIKGDETDLRSFNDYNLSLCNQYGMPPLTQRDATAFGVFVQLEFPEAFPASSQPGLGCGIAPAGAPWSPITTN